MPARQLELSLKRRRQQDAIATDLLSGAPVDSVSAADRHSIWRLSGIIYRLRRQGWPVIAERDHQNGLAHYRLPQGWNPGAATAKLAPAPDLSTGQKINLAVQIGCQIVKLEPPATITVAVKAV